MSTASRRCFIGFDGFTDTIVRAVDQRASINSFSEFKTIKEFSNLIAQFEGKSGNIELVTQTVKMGGNGPLFAHALATAGHQITYAGLIGSEELEPLFEPMRSSCHKLIPLGKSGQTIAIEFDSGKVMLGLHDSLHQFSLASLDQASIKQELEQADLIGTVNWTMLLGMTGIWEWIARLNLPSRPWMFIDLADPKKRTQQDLQQALYTLSQLQNNTKVVLGLNESEARQTAQALDTSADPASIRAKLAIEQVVIHETKRARAASAQESCEILGPYTPHPKISTGAGDHFNAGYVHALLNDGSLKQAVQCGVLWSGYYVRHATSPTPSLAQTWSAQEAPELAEALGPLDAPHAPPL